MKITTNSIPEKMNANIFLSFITAAALLLLTSLLLPGMSFAENTIFQQTVRTVDGRKVKLVDFKGKSILFVNIATRCGYTGQLTGLEKLYQKHKDKGLVVIGVPSNDFGGQTPESGGDLKKFCKFHHGVSFPLLEKTAVKGKKKHPLIASLINQSESKKEIGWNFEKFLVDKNGKLTARFESSVTPDDSELSKAIQAAL